MLRQRENGIFSRVYLCQSIWNAIYSLPIIFDPFTYFHPISIRLVRPFELNLRSSQITHEMNRNNSIDGVGFVFILLTTNAPYHSRHRFRHGVYKLKKYRVIFRVLLLTATFIHSAIYFACKFSLIFVITNIIIVIWRKCLWSKILITFTLTRNRE